MNRLKNILNLLRYGHWAKNLFLFIPIFFAGELLNLKKIESVFFAFFAFCCTASAIYVINDIMDVESDKQHPEKKNRPIAAGVVTLKSAYLIFIVLVLGTILFSMLTYSYSFGIILLSYFIINLFYTFGLKRVPILEILIVSTGFVLRVIAGGLVAVVEVSQWMVMMIFLLSLFLALAKRRDDIFISGVVGKTIRKGMETYSIEYLNALIIMVSGIIIVSYLMYVISPEVITRFHSRYLYATSIFVIAGVMRYLQITLVENKSGSPTHVLYKDNFIRITLLGWICTFYILIYIL